MVKRLIIILICPIVACVAMAADQHWYQFPNAMRMRDDSRFLVYDNMSGATRNMTGGQLRGEMAGPTAKGYDGRPGANGYDGRPGAPPLFCNMTGGTRSITYDAVGLNPQPAMTPYQYILYVGGQVVTALRQIWSTGAGIVTGSSAGISFTPTVNSSYSPGNNYVAVQATYSSSAATGGKRFCQASVPISVTKIGPQGIKGDPGSNATVTEQNIMAAMAAGNSDNPLVLQSTTPGQVKLDIRDEGANTRFFVDSAGQAKLIGGPLRILGSSGGYLFKIDSNNGSGPTLSLSGGGAQG
jgi:hypothetical protein